MALPVVAIVETGEGLQPAVVELVARLAEHVRAEDGCESYEAFTSGRKRVVLLEQWRDGAALQAHASATPFSELMAGLEQLGLPAPAVHVLRPVVATG